MSDLDDLVGQALGAIHAGANPDDVNQMLYSEAAKLGYDPSKLSFNLVNDNPDAQPAAPKVSKAVKQQYKDIVRPDVVQDVAALNRVPNSPQQGIFQNVQGDSDTSAPMDAGDAFAYGAEGAIKRGLAGLRLASAPVMGLLNPGYSNLEQQQALAEAAQLNAAGKEDLANAQGKAGFAGQVAGGFAGGFLGQPAAEAMDKLDQGKSLTEAELTNLKGSAINEAGAALGLLGPQTAGLMSYVARAGIQGGGNLALTAGDKLLEGEPITRTDVAMALGGGLLGGLARNEPRTPKTEVEAEIPKTGDADIDAGAKWASDIADNKPTDLTKIDVSNQRQFGQEFDPGWRYKNIEPTKSELNIETSPADAVQKMNDIESAYAVRRQRLTDEAFAQSDREQNAQEISRAALDEDAPEIQQPSQQPNDVLNTPEMADLRNQLRVEQATQNAGMPKQPVDVNIVDPTENLMAARQQKLGKQKLSVDQNGNTIDTSPLKQAKPIKTEDDLAAALKNVQDRGNIFDAVDVPKNADGTVSVGPDAQLPYLAKTAKISNFVRNKLSEGTLTGRDALNAIIENHGDLYRDADVVKGFTKQLLDAGEKLGGLDVKFHALDDTNPTHQDLIARNPELRNPNVSQRPAATWDPKTNAIYLNHGVSMPTLVHEVGHSIFARALEMGEAGKLSGNSRKAYQTMQVLFDSLKPHLDDIANQQKAKMIVGGADPEFASRVVNSQRQYGMSNLHEFTSELFSNPYFRDHLKSLKLTPEIEGKLGFGRLALGKIRNAYQAVVGLARNVLGLSPKADNALDAMFSAHHDFVNSLDRTESSVISAQNNRGHTLPSPDMSFLGEQAPSRFAAPTEPEQQLQKPRSRPLTLARQLFNPKGIEPVVTGARNTRSGINAEGAAEAVQSANRLKAVTTDENRANLSKAMQGDLEAYGKLSPAAKEVVKAEYTNNYNRSIAIVKSIVADPNATAEQKAIGKKILENAGSYQTRVYESDVNKRYMKDKLATANTAADKLSKGQNISDKEMEAYKSVDEARKYLENQWLPDTNKLPKMETTRLEDLYKLHTGLDADQQFKGFDTEDRRNAMAGAVADAMRKIVSRDGALQNILESAAGLGEKKSTTRLYYQGLRRTGNVYSTLQNVPAELRQFWGEISDPVARNISTVRQQYSYLANLKAQNQLRTEGLGKIFTDAMGTPGYTETITGEKMGPLQGLRTTPDVKRALDSVFMMDSTLGDLLDASLADQSGNGLILGAARRGINGLARVTGVAKAATVLGNAGNFVNNFIGSHLQLASNGNVNPAAWGKGMKMMADTLGSSVRKGMSQDARDALRYGLVEFSHIEELRGNANSKKMNDILRNAAGTDNPVTTLARTIKGMGREGLSLYKELYGAMDLWTKFANWHSELDFWRGQNEKLGTGLSDEQIKTNVARRINDTNITPSMAPQVLKAFERLGVTRFGTYYAEVARTNVNNLRYGMQDLRQGLSTSNGDLILHGFKRLAGTIGGVAAQNKQFAALAKITAGAMGLAATQLAPDDPRKKYMDKDDFMQSMDPMILSDPAHPEDGKYVYDLSRADPYAPINTPVKQFIFGLNEYLTGDKKKGAEQIELAGNSLVGLWSKNTVWSALSKIKEGNAPSIAKQSPEAYAQMSKLLTDAGMSVSGANKLLDAVAPFTPKTISNVLQADSVKSPALKQAIVSGQGITQFSPAKDLSGYLGGSAKSDITKAKGDYLALMKQNYESSPERLDKSFVQTMKDAAEPYSKLSIAVQAAKAEGTKRSEIIQRLEASGISDDMVATLISNKPLKIYTLQGDLDKDMENDIISSIPDKAKQKEAMQRFKYNTKQIQQLIRKYRNTNVEDL